MTGDSDPTPFQDRDMDATVRGIPAPTGPLGSMGMRFTREAALKAAAEAAEEEKLLRVYIRARKAIDSFFDESPAASWVAVGEETGYVFNGGDDDALPSQHTHSAQEEIADERIRLLARPTDLGAEGMTLISIDDLD